MAGIYVHIPFCASRCIYCDFYSTTRLEARKRYVRALCSELEQRRNEPQQKVETVYVGGGTPSQLSADELRLLFDHIDTEAATEVTLECNPDDVTPSLARLIGELPVNRVSMGAQTFCDERLRLLRRRHTAAQVERAVGLLRDAGIGNISIDLIYGLPGEQLDDWHQDIDRTLALKPEHISAYALMYEEGTVLHAMLAKGQVEETDEELSLRMYADLTDRLREAGYEHYEISNFAREVPATPFAAGRSYRSLHNSNYWNHTPYLGIGASAHSFNGERRQWNVSDIDTYMEGIEMGKPVFDYEVIDEDTFYNEQIMTSLRTCEGLMLDSLEPSRRSFCLKQAKRFIDDGLLIHEGNRLVLSRRGVFVSNMIMSELMKT